jgi:hypothetical protein
MRLFAMCLIAATASAHAHAQCSSFQPAYPGLNGEVRALASWDPDGSGPLPPRLVAGGAFTYDGHGSQDYIAYWDGQAWAALGWGTDGPVNAITTWDPDGPGPLPPQLIIGGEFMHVGADSTGQVAANHIARWDGAAWQPLSIGADGPVDALTTWDPDGDGPQPPVLVAAGRFTHIGGAWTGGVARWDGAAWRAFGWGIDGSGAALTVWDPDGPGPQIPNLVVGGSFPHAGADSTGQIDAHNIVRWDGTAWRAVGTGLSPNVSTMIVFDVGDGPQLLAGGGFDLKRWTGTQWEEFGDGFQFYEDVNSSGFQDPSGNGCTGGGYLAFRGVPIALAAWDPDGSGPAPAQLYASATVSFHDGRCCNYEGGCIGCDCDLTRSFVACFDGDSFRPISALPAATSFLSDSTGNLVLGSSSSPFLFRDLPYSPAVITTQPEPFVAHKGDTATFAVFAEHAVSYRWYQYSPNHFSRFSPLYDGNPWPYGGIVSGSFSSQLTIAAIQPIGAQLYRCEITQADCTTIISDAVALTVVPGSCSADFNHDGDAGTDADIEAFFACLAGNCCPTCGDPDFNGDGDIGTDADIESFFRVLAGGNC